VTPGQKPRRIFLADLAAEQRRISGGTKANKRTKLLEDLPGIGQVFETGAGREFEPSERLSEIRRRIENKLSGDDLRRFDKRSHARILTWLKRVAIHAELRRAGAANDKSYAAIGAEAVDLLGFLSILLTGIQYRI
jgi:hypothetical protein